MMTNGIGNVLVGQSGGPTAVINASLAGVYEAARSLGAPRIYGMKYGIQGFLQGNLVELDKLNGIFKINGVDILQKVREMT